MRPLVVTGWQIGQVEARHRGLKQARIKCDRSHFALPPQSHRHILELRQALQHGNGTPYVPDALSIERLAEESEAPANVDVLGCAILGPARRTDAARADVSLC